MSSLDMINDSSAAALLSFFSLHHLELNAVKQALIEWRRILQPGGQLVIAAWEGTGEIDYGSHSDIRAFNHSAADMRSWVEAAGFDIDRCKTEQVEDMGMDALYLEATAIVTPDANN